MRLVLCFCWLCFAAMTWGRSVVTNDFGICYDTQAKSFSFASRVYRKAPPVVYWSSLFTEWYRCSLVKTIETGQVFRINRHFYYAVYQEQTKREKFLAGIVLSRVNYSDYFVYAALFDEASPLSSHRSDGQKQSAKISAEGEFLFFTEWAPELRGFLFQGESFIPVRTDERLDVQIHHLSERRYVLVWDGIRPLCRNCVMLIDLNRHRFVQLPLSSVYTVWNQVVHGMSIRENDKGEVWSSEVLYDTRTGISQALPRTDEVIEHVYYFNDNFVLAKTQEGKMVRLNLETGDCQPVSARYVRNANTFLKWEDDRLVAIIDQKGNCLWEGAQERNIDIYVNLDNDLYNDAEALILKDGARSCLIDCMGEKVYYADEVEHVGLGFFALRTNGKTQWITL